MGEAQEEEQLGEAAGRFFDIKQAAVHLGMSVTTLYRLTSRRQVPYLKIGRMIRFDREELSSWMTGFRVKPAHKDELKAA